MRRGGPPDGRRGPPRRLARQVLAARAAERAARWAGARTKPRRRQPVSPALAERARDALVRLTGTEPRVTAGRIELYFESEVELEEMVEAALALVGAARRMGISAKARGVRGVDRVMLYGDGTTGPLGQGIATAVAPGTTTIIATLDKTVVFLGITSSVTPAFKAIVPVRKALAALGAQVAALRDHEQAKIATEQNEIVKRLTVTASLLLFPTFWVGVYGQNFEHMPELHWRGSYPGVVLLMVVLGVMLWRGFKRAEWL